MCFNGPHFTWRDSCGAQEFLASHKNLRHTAVVPDAGDSTVGAGIQGLSPPPSSFGVDLAQLLLGLRFFLVVARGLRQFDSLSRFGINSAAFRNTHRVQTGMLR